MNNSNQYIDFDLLAKFFANECSDAEKHSVEEWRGKSVENNIEFDKLQKVFCAKLPEIEVELDLAWQKVNKRMAESGKLYTLTPTKMTNKPRWVLRIAAILVLGILLYLTSQQFFATNKSIAYNAENEPVIVNLADGSTVQLNSKTDLIFTENNKNKTRNVELSGEAFFEVKRNEQRPFIIKTAYLEIEVLGTSFNVWSEPQTDSAKITVSSGTVKVNLNDKSKEFILQAGESAVYRVKEQSFKKLINTNNNEMYWRTGSLVFKGEKLKNVAKIISMSFGINLRVNEDVANCKINASFENDSLETILEVIATTLQLQLEKNENNYVLQGKGC